jgi:hypothetical protein
MRNMVVSCLMTMVLIYGTSLAHAQQEAGTTDASRSPKRTAEESNPKPNQHKPIQPYRLDFSVNELENGKKINSRHYSMDLTAGSANEVKIGTRVPVTTGPSQFQYIDVGTNIWANLREDGDDLQLEIRSDVSNLDMSPAHDHDALSAPIVRQIKINGSTLLITGKPIIIGTMDDPNSNREFQLEVIATKMR